MKYDASDIFALYELHGMEDYIGEPVSQLEHMLQAGELARAQGYGDEVVLAAFFHDLGHLLAFREPAEVMDGLGVVCHEKLGADLLRSAGFSETIAALVESHVQAKRYLTFKYPEYYEKLSVASKHTLDLQGGRMSEEEALIFEADPLVDLKVKLRLWDDEAKSIEPTGQHLAFFRELASKHLGEQSKTGSDGN
jgi:phosphonate degradation associated HDIG domain protein